MDNVLSQLSQQAPYMVLIVILVMVFLNWVQKLEKFRVENATQLEDKREAHENELEEKRQEHDRDMNNMWANSIKLLIDQQEKAHQAMMSALERHDKASQERYDKIGITNDLIQAVKNRQSEGRRR